MEEKNPATEEPSFEEEGQLTVDVYEVNDTIIVESTIAGVEAHDIDIDVTHESITIRGERKNIDHIPEKNYYYQECFWGKFSRSIILPEEVDPDRSDAEMKNGILRVTMPKAKRVASKKLAPKGKDHHEEEHIDTH